MRLIDRISIGSGIVLLGLMTLYQSASASALNYTAEIKSQETRYRTPEDLLSMVPLLGDIPRTFLIGDGYKMDLSIDEMRIDHMATNSRSPMKHRICNVSLSYALPVAGFFSSSFDFLLFNGDTFKPSDLSMSTLGDYVIHLSRQPLDGSTLKLVANARF